MTASSEGEKAYWRAIIRMTLGLLFVWFLVSYGAGILFREFLDQISIGGTEAGWWFGISPEGIGFVFMWLALTVGIITALVTPAPPSAIQQLVEDIRIPG